MSTQITQSPTPTDPAAARAAPPPDSVLQTAEPAIGPTSTVGMPPHIANNV